VIFDEGFLPLDLDTSVSNCKAAVLVLVHPWYFISPVNAISGEHSPIRHRGRRPVEVKQLLTVQAYSLYIKKVNQSHYRPEVPRGFQEVKVPTLRDNGPEWW
jgi:hypothetical protein